MILGMRYALKKGFSSICIQGDSKLVCMQIDGSWKVKNENLSTLYKVAKELKDQFSLFQISHVLREDLQKEIGEGASENEAYVKVFGKENSSYVRGMGFGVRPSQVIGFSSRSRESMQYATTSGPSRTEYQNLTLQVQLLQEQVNFLVNRQRGQLPPGFPTELQILNHWHRQDHLLLQVMNLKNIDHPTFKGVYD